jgi:hypothetical protein
MKSSLSVALRSVVSFALVVSACGGTITPLEERNCPCADAYTCCNGRCVANGESCSAQQQEHPSDVPFLPSTNTDGALRVFITSTFHDGNFGGYDGADAFCRKAANDAGLGGKWVAFLFSSTTSVVERVKSDGPWYRLDGTTLVYANRDAFRDRPRNLIDKDEEGRPYGGYAWCGNIIDGTESCSEWTSSNGTGVSIFAGRPTDSITSEPCTTKHNLLCIEDK